MTGRFTNDLSVHLILLTSALILLFLRLKDHNFEELCLLIGNFYFGPWKLFEILVEYTLSQ